MLAFSLAVVLLLAFSLPSGTSMARRASFPVGTVPMADVLAGFLWVTVLFAGLVAGQLGTLPPAHLRAGLAELQRRRVTGKDVTPFLLAWFHEQTHGASLATNVALVLANAELAGRIALAR